MAGPTDLPSGASRMRRADASFGENLRLRTETVPDIDKRHSIFINVRRLMIKSEICHIRSEAIIAPDTIITKKPTAYTRRAQIELVIYASDFMP